MQKAIQVVLLGADQNWMTTTDIGMQVSTEVCVSTCNLINSKIIFPSSYLRVIKTFVLV